MFGGRISDISQQSGTTPEYFLGNALGSIRQMTDPAGTVTFARNYDPYGTVTFTGGTSSTAYGFTGETTDPSTGSVGTANELPRGV